MVPTLYCSTHSTFTLIIPIPYITCPHLQLHFPGPHHNTAVMGGDWVNITTEIQKALKKSTSKRGKTNADFLKKMIYNNVCLEGFLVLRNFGLYPTIHDDLERTAPWLYRITKLFMEGSQNPQATRQKEISSATSPLQSIKQSSTINPTQERRAQTSL